MVIDAVDKLQIQIRALSKREYGPDALQEAVLPAISAFRGSYGLGNVFDTNGRWEVG
jgi:hypothetical protein